MVRAHRAVEAGLVVGPHALEHVGGLGRLVVSVSAYRPHLDAAEEERLGKLVIAAASRISDRLGDLGNMVSL